MTTDATKACDLAVEVFGRTDKALKWLNKPKIEFGWESAITIMDSPGGVDLVVEALIKIDEGYMA